MESGQNQLEHFNYCYKIILISLGSLASPSPIDYKSGKELKFRVGQNIDGINVLFRISVLPTTFGENIAIRKLPTVGNLPSIYNLGLSNEAINFFTKNS